jgi:hypothetical protein
MQGDGLRQRLGPGRALLMRYEDFMTNTIPVLDNIHDFIGVDLSNIQRVIGEGGKLDFDHTIAGNRELKFDQEWRQQFPRAIDASPNFYPVGS